MTATPTVLVVDDEAAVREVCRRLLAPQGMTVDAAASGDEAAALCARAAYGLVLTDISMPGRLSGTDLLKEIKGRWPDTDVIIMTAYPAFENAVEALKGGAYDYLIKPFDRDTLLSTVQRCLEKRRLKEELNAEKALRRELEAAYGELQKVERLKEGVMARLSHELKTPLASSLLALGLLENGPAAGAEKPLRSLRTSLTRLQETVDELLLHADLSKGRHAPALAPTDAAAVLNSLRARFAEYAQQRGVSLHFLFAKNLPMVQADRADMETAFKHLLLNGIHFCRSGGRVDVRTSVDGESLRVEFQDNGIGIPAELQSRVFDGYYQAADYLTREVGGLGLGLAIVRKIAEAHGGQVSLVSREGQGTCFHTVWPLVSPGGEAPCAPGAS